MNWNTGYTPWYQQPQQQNNISIAFVQGGEEAVRNYMVAPNQSVILVDNEAGIISIKATDVSGMPIPVRTFVEKKPAPVQQAQSNYVTRDEFEKRLQEVLGAKLPEQQQQ